VGGWRLHLLARATRPRLGGEGEKNGEPMNKVLENIKEVSLLKEGGGREKV